MKFKPLCFPLLPLLLTTLALIQVHPTAALQFPASLPVTLVGLFQQYYVQHDSSAIHATDVDLEDFWQGARDLGEKAQNYGEDLMKKAAERSQEVGQAVTEVKERIRTIVRSATAWHEELNALNTLRAQQSHSTATAVSLDGITADLEAVFGKVLEELEIMFPAPDHAPGHEERATVVEAALEKAGEALVTLCSKYGMDEDRVRVHWDVVRGPINTAVVLIGDLAEQHPDLLEGVLFFAAVAIIPNSWLLRPLLTVFGFGPTGPIKGSTAAWAQRVFYGAAVSKGSWFAKLQQAAMSTRSWWQRLLEWLGWA